MKIAAGLTIVLVVGYFMVDHSGPFYFQGVLLNEQGEAMENAEVTYEYMLVNGQAVEQKSVKTTLGLFRIAVQSTEIAYVKITGVWEQGKGAALVRDILPTMVTTEETRLLFEPGSFFQGDERHWNPRETYIFQEGKSVRAELPTVFEE